MSNPNTTITKNIYVLNNYLVRTGYLSYTDPFLLFMIDGSTLGTLDTINTTLPSSPLAVMTNNCVNASVINLTVY